jgi:hypothetical protein
LGPNGYTPRNRTDLNVAPGLHLLGYEVEPEALHPGEPIRIALILLATGPIAVDYQVRVALRDGAGREVAASVGPPADGSYATTLWRPDDLVRDVHDLVPPADLPKGGYVLTVAIVPPGDTVGRPLAVGRIEAR